MDLSQRSTVRSGEDDHVRAFLAGLPEVRDRISLSHRLCASSVRVTDCDGGAITLEYAGVERLTVATVGPLAARLEDLQELAREGPGWDAHRQFHAVATRLADARAWPVLASALLPETGPLWIGAAPIRAGSELIGVFTLHRRLRPGDPSPDELPLPTVQAVQFLADCIGAALHSAPEISVDSYPSWTARTRVHRATGMVVSQLSLPVVDALAILRAHAFARGTSLQDVADDVVTGRFSFAPALDVADRSDRSADRSDRTDRTDRSADRTDRSAERTDR